MSGLFSGLRAWTLQRITALVILAFLLVPLIRFATEPPYSFEACSAWWRAPAVAAATLVFFGAVCLHAWVGARDVVLDYVHPLALRAAALSLTALGLGALFAWMAVILLGV